MAKQKPYQPSEEERAEHVTAQESYAYHCGKQDVVNKVERVFKDPHLQAIYEQGKKHGA